MNFYLTKNPNLKKYIYFFFFFFWGGGGGGSGMADGEGGGRGCDFFDNLTKNPNLKFFPFSGGGGAGRRGLAGVSEFLTKNSNLQKQKNFFGGRGAWGGYVNVFDKLT